MDNLKLGNFIKSLRKEKNMTQKDLAKKIGLTDKAISKWERGLSFPDITILNSLAEVFDVDVSEILNGERGTNKINSEDIEKKIEEAVEKVTLKKEKRERRIKLFKKISGIISSVVFTIFIIIQCVYLFFLKPKGYEYISDLLFYIVNEIIIITLGIIFFTLINFKKNFIKNIIVSCFIIILSIINIAFMVNNGFESKSIIEFSKDFSNELVLKKNNKTGVLTYYKNTKLLFVKGEEILDDEVDGKIKTSWLNNDICSITYENKDGSLEVFVATYGGDASKGYYYVSNVLFGKWATFSQYGEGISFIVDDKGLTIKEGENSELFEAEDIKQYGVTSIVLYKNNIPCYIIGLNEDCVIDNKTDLIKKGGTITLTKVSMDNERLNVLECVSNKDGDLENYNIVSVGKNDYKIENGILYISYDGKNVIKVPGVFEGVTSFDDGKYKISKEKTFFVKYNNGNEEFIFSDNMGISWKTTELGVTSVQNIDFINSNTGYMLEFKDVAMGIAFGDIKKTKDGGKTWNVVFNGIGNTDDKVFKIGSNIEFIDENIGFLTMPSTGGETSELYITKDGGFNFSKLELEQTEEGKNIYDYYNLPKEENGELILEIGQGSDR